MLGLGIPRPVCYLSANSRLSVFKPAGFGLTRHAAWLPWQMTGGPKTEGEGKMGNLCVYQVVIESSDEQKTYHKDYVGPASGDDDAIRRAWTVFKKRADDRVVKVQQVDEDVWDEDVAALPPDGPEWVPS
jgi:hypothetical protein